METVDATHGFALREWQAMGCPEPPDRQQTRRLREAALRVGTETVRAAGAGVLRVNKMLQPWAVMSINQDSRVL